MSAASRLLQQSPEILRRWDLRVRAEIPASREQQALVLANNLQPLLREVARALEKDDEPEARLDGLTLSQDHGGQRALLKEYSLAEMFLEYRLLRQTTLEVLDETRSLSAAEREVITNALEGAMQEAVSQFAAIHHDLERRRAEEAERVAGELESAYRREQRIAHVLQRPLLMKVSPDAFPGLEVAAWYEPALGEAEVGGDFYDLFALANGNVALVVADTCGKGLEAAAHNAQFKDVLRAFLREQPSEPGLALGRLNAVVCDTLRGEPSTPDYFVVLSLAVLDPRTGEAVVASAGAEPVLLVRAEGEAGPVESRGMALGIRPDELYDPVRLQLSPGDAVLLVTDGITEARANGQLLGYDGLTRLAQLAVRSRPLAAAADEIAAGARKFARGHLRDDACMVLARKEAPGPASAR